MSSIIDMSLSKTPVCTLYPDKNAGEEYVRLLTESGVDYFEIGTKMLEFLPKDGDLKKFILRVERKEDAALCADFGYAAVPLELAKLCTKISKTTRVILEVRADVYSAPAVIMHAMSLRAAKNISMLRIIYDAYSYNGEEINELIKWYKDKYMVPLDVCPMNFYMTGNITALCAESAGAEAVTLTYGSNIEFTSFESFIIERCLTKGGELPAAVINGISKSSKLFARIFGRLPCGIMDMDILAQRLESPLADIETGNVYRIYRPVGTKKRGASESAIEKKIKSLGYDEELEKYLLELLKKVML